MTDRNTYSGVFEIGEPFGHTDTYNELITGPNGTTMRFYDHASGPVLDVVNMAVGTWYWLACAIGDSTVSCYHAVEGQTSITKQTAAKTNIPEIDTTTLMSTTFHSTEWFNGEFCRHRIWDAILSDADLLAEYLSPTFVRGTDLVGSWHFQDVASKNADSSGLGNTLTDHGTGVWTEGTGPFIGAPVE